MKVPIDLSGQRFDRLTVLKLNGSKNGFNHWQARCDCGREISVRTASLRNGHTKSCGCFGRDVRRKRNTTHGFSGTPTYTAWEHMLARCRNKRHASFKDYGARGIIACSRWEKFENFLHDMGAQPEGLTLERIDNNAGYSPSNCKWATRREQSNNRRNSRFLNLGGETFTITTWCRNLGGSHALVDGRLRAGWSIQRALSEPSRAKGGSHERAA